MRKSFCNRIIFHPSSFVVSVRISLWTLLASHGQLWESEMFALIPGLLLVEYQDPNESVEAEPNGRTNVRPKEIDVDHIALL